MIDLRSDTVTQPTDAMREAMGTAIVGDDDYGEDPTANRLQKMAAALLAKESALFVPSGTMANLLAVLTHTRHGDEVIVEHRSHIYLDEAGGMSAIGRVIARPIESRYGTITPEQLRDVLRPIDRHYAPTRLLCLENTHNAAGGTVITPDVMTEICEAAHSANIRVHLDGARIFNAAAALRVDPRQLVHGADSMMFCLSKGLSAPAGSILLGDADFIARARNLRKMLGGGMRQVGVLAAAGIVALETMVERLADDNLHARMLATQLSGMPGIEIDLALVQTNIVMVHVTDAPWTVERLAVNNVLTNAEGQTKIRLVTHRHIGEKEVAETVHGFRKLFLLD